MASKKKKAGLDYQDVVELIMNSLESDKRIETGQWVEGPDGEREIDVAIYGKKANESLFILVECKDYRTRKVGIGAIDALDSKSKDLKADKVILVSNSGFSKDALKKAYRKGIYAVSAMKQGDKRVKFELQDEVICKSYGIERFNVSVHTSDNNQSPPESSWGLRDIKFENSPIINWLNSRLAHYIKPEQGNFNVEFQFVSPQTFQISDKNISLNGITIQMECSSKWVSQTVPIELSLGLFDHVLSSLTILPNESITIGWFDMENFKETDLVRNDSRPGLKIDIDLIKNLPAIENAGTPSLDEIILNENKYDT